MCWNLINTSFKYSLKMAAAVCNICCESYNSASRAQVTCRYSDCNFDACKNCVRKYLLTTSEDPHCMNCKKMWSQDFLVMNLNRSFITKDFKERRSDLILEQEMSKMPSTIPAAERAKTVQEMESEIKDIDAELASLNEKIFQVKRKKRLRQADINMIMHKPTKKEVQQFVMPCPSPDCRGFLSSQYKCKMCNIHTCSKCLEIIGEDKDAEHVCDKEKVETADYIKQNTKPCPCCGQRISKVSGCDQMWCVECHTAFSWTHGTIEKGVVHNPHFYEFQRNVNNGAAPRNPGDVVCGGLCLFMNLRGHIIASRTKDRYGTDWRRLFSYHQLVSHIQNVEIVSLRREARNQDANENIRVSYLLNEIDKEQLRTKLYSNDVVRKMKREMLYVFELWDETNIDLFAQIMAISHTDQKFAEKIEAIIDNMHGLVDYCNSQFENISIIYNRTAPYISWGLYTEYSSSPSWNIRNRKCKKYNEVRMKKNATSPSEKNLAAAEE